MKQVSWSAFTAMLAYKALLYGRELVRIGRFEPTSQVCSACGMKDGPMPLDIGYGRAPDAVPRTIGM